MLGQTDQYFLFATVYLLARWRFYFTVFLYSVRVVKLLVVNCGVAYSGELCDGVVCTEWLTV